MAGTEPSTPRPNAGQVHSEAASEHAAPEQTGKFGNRNVAKVDAERHIPENEDIRAFDDEIQIKDRDIETYKSPIEHYKDCEFQQQIAHGLLDHEEPSNDLVVYYLNENDEKVVVAPRRGDNCPQDIYDEYVRSMEELREKSTAILAQCDKELVSARLKAGIPEGESQADMLNVADSSPILLSQLLSKANGETTLAKDAVPEENDSSDSSVEDNLYANFHEAEALPDDSQALMGDVEVKPGDVPHDEVLPEEGVKQGGHGTQLHEHATTVVTPSDQDRQNPSQRPSDSSDLAQPDPLEAVSGKADGEVIPLDRTTDVPPSTVEPASVVESEATEIPAPLADQKQEGDKPAALPELVKEEKTAGETEQGHEPAESNDSAKGKGTEPESPGAPAILSGSTRLVPDFILGRSGAKPDKQVDEQGYKEDPEITPETKRINVPEYKPGTYDKGTLEEIRKSIKTIEMAKEVSDRPTQKFSEDFLSETEKLLKERAKMEDECTKLEQQDKSVGERYSRNPPDSILEKNMAIKYRQLYIKKAEYLIKSFDEKAGELKSTPPWYGRFRSVLNDEVKSLQDANQYDKHLSTFIKEKLDQTSVEDIGVSADDIDSQIKAVASQASYQGNLSVIMEEIDSEGAKGSIKEGVRRGANNVIRGIIDTKETIEHNDSESIIKGCRASRLVQAIAESMLKNAWKEMNAVKRADPLESANEVRKIRDKYEGALRQLYPSRWGSSKLGSREGQISKATYHHINQSIDNSLRDLGVIVRNLRVNKANDDQLVATDINKSIDIAFESISDKKLRVKAENIKNKITNPGHSLLSDKGIRRVTSLINTDSEFCEGLVAGFSSLQDTFAEELTIGNSYQQRSAGIMRMLRINHKLTDALSAPDVLAAVIHDVGQPDSKLMPHFINRYGGRDKTNKGAGDLRSKKIIGQAIEFLANEKSDKSVPVLPNESARQCFRSGAFYEKSIASSGNEAKLGTGDQLLNTFLRSVQKAAVIYTPQTQEYHVNTGAEIKDKPVVFSGEPLSTEFLGSRWAIDPGFIIDDHPDLRVPFETKDEGQRDWIPLKDTQSGKTAILAMSKKAGKPKPFLYELDSDNQWRCVPLAVSGKPGEANQEELEGTLFALSACSHHGQTEQIKGLAGRARLLANKVYGEQSERYTQSLTDEFEELTGGSNGWITQSEDVEALVKCVEEADASQQAYDLSDIKGFGAVRSEMRKTAIEQPKAFKIQEIKQAKDEIKAHGNAVVDIQAEQQSRDIGTFHLPPGYHCLKTTLVNGLKQQYKKHDSMLERVDQVEDSIGQYGKEASAPSLHVFKGCIIDVGEYGSVQSMEDAKQALKTVIAKSRRHMALLFQEREKNKEVTQRLLNKTEGTNAHLFEHALLLFERNKIPEGLNKNEKTEYMRSMANYLLLSNAYQVEHQQLDKKEQLLKSFDVLELDRIDQSRDEFIQAARKWNLEMALVAEQQWVVDHQLGGYEGAPLDSRMLARLAFECRAKTVLRSNQVAEVDEALDQITKAMDSRDTVGMQRVSQKGTGWGKSTVIKMLSDHASNQLSYLDSETAQNRSVLVVAPKSNQAELDISLGQYFRQGGREYRRLDMSQYTSSGWWRGRALDDIHNTLLGLDPKTPVEERQQLAATLDRAPVGASIEDIQILLHLKKALEKNASIPGDRQALDKLNRISDLLRESMVFGDEWDSALMPPDPGMLDDMSDAINKSLRSVPGGYTANSDNICRVQASFILGAKRKHLLSATTGSMYTLLQATDTENAADAAKVSHLSLLQSNYRAIRWLAEAKTIFCRDSENLEADIARQVVAQIRPDQGIIYLDGRKENSGKGDELAQKLRTELADVRGGKKLSTLYYDGSKRIHQIYTDAYGAEKTDFLGKVEEKVARQEGAKGFDTILSLREGVGTDCPQGANTPLVHVGLLSQQEGKLDYAAQQLGRMRHDSEVAKQPKMLVVTAQELREIARSETPAQDLASRALASQESAAEAESALLASVNDDLKGSEKFQRLLTKTLDFPVEGETEDDLQKGLDKALDAIAKEWRNIAGITSEDLDAIKAVKRAQFQADLDTKHVLFGLFSERDRSKESMAAEERIQQTKTSALAEGLLAEEQLSFDSIAKSKVKELRQKLEEDIADSITATFPEKGKEYASEKAEQIASKVADETSQSIKGVVRPVLPANGRKALEGLKNTSFTAERVEKVVQEQVRKPVNSIEQGVFIKYEKAREQYESEVKRQLHRLSNAWRKMSRTKSYKKSVFSLKGNKEPGILSVVDRVDEAMKKVESGTYPVAAANVVSLRKEMLRVLGNMYASNARNVEPQEFQEKIQEILEDILDTKEGITKNKRSNSYIIELSEKEKIELSINDYNPGCPGLKWSGDTSRKLKRNHQLQPGRSIELMTLAKTYTKAKTEYQKIESVDKAIKGIVSTVVEKAGDELKSEMTLICTGDRAEKIEQLLEKENKRAAVMQGADKKT